MEKQMLHHLTSRTGMLHLGSRSGMLQYFFRACVSDGGAKLLLNVCGSFSKYITIDNNGGALYCHTYKLVNYNPPQCLVTWLLD